MPNRKRREQQHLRQESTRKRAYTAGSTAPKEVYKPGFPMNLLGNIKFFSIVGIVIAVIMVVTMVWTQGLNANRTVATPPTNTPSASASANASTSATASASATANPKQFAKAEQVIDATKNTYTATIKTAKGDINIKLNADQAPNTVNSFVFLAQQHFFDGITFHRVVPNFVIQSGDPTGKGSGGPGYTTNDEPNQVSNKRGTISMAKTQGATSFGSQWFINLKDNVSLDYNNPADKFYPFGEVTGDGMAVADKIAQGDVIQSITITATPK